MSAAEPFDSLDALRRVAQLQLELAQGGDLDACCLRASALVCELCGADGAVVAMRDEEALRLLGGTGTAAVFNGLRLSSDASLAARCFREQRTISCADLDQLNRRELPLRRMGRWASGLAAPLWHDGQVVGSLTVGSLRTGAFGEREEQLTTVVACAVAAVVARAILQQELSALKEQVLLSDRRATLGSVAAGVAHEIKNPLSYVLANLQFAREELVDADGVVPSAHRDVVKALDETLHGVEQIRAITSDVLSFARPREVERAATPVQASVDSAVQMARGEVQRVARLKTDFHPLPQILGDSVRLSQVVLNLVLNAAQAFPGPGPGNEVKVSTFTAEGGACIEVADTGVGIRSEDLPRLFEPYFTTKASAGTGLGLGLCRDIVASMNGTITIRSEPGQGTRVQVWLPSAASTAAFPVHPRSDTGLLAVPGPDAPDALPAAEATGSLERSDAASPVTPDVDEPGAAPPEPTLEAGSLS